MKRKITQTFFVVFISLCHSMAQYPPAVEQAIAQTKTNKAELTKALDYFFNKRQN
jgi:hypothetical protein